MWLPYRQADDVDISETSKSASVVVRWTESEFILVKNHVLNTDQGVVTRQVGDHVTCLVCILSVEIHVCTGFARYIDNSYGNLTSDIRCVDSFNTKNISVFHKFCFASIRPQFLTRTQIFHFVGCVSQACRDHVTCLVCILLAEIHSSGNLNIFIIYKRQYLPVMTLENDQRSG
jgi:hypothetical protein